MEGTCKMNRPSELKPWMKLWQRYNTTQPDLDCTTVDYIKKANQGHDNEVALNYFDRKITYGELFTNIETTAKAYAKLGVKKDDILTLVSVMTPETIYSFYSMSMIGSSLNMADPRTSSHGLHEYIAEVHSKIVIVLSDAYGKVKEAVKGTDVEKVIVVSPADSLSAMKKLAYKVAKPDRNEYDSNVIMWNDFMKIGDAVSEVPHVPFAPNHVTVIVHTGGTTGTPKGVMLGARAFNALAFQMTMGRFHRQDRFLNIMPPFIAYGFGCGVHAPLSEGAEIILIPAFDPKTFGKLLNKYHPQHTAGVPLHYQNLLTDPTMKGKDLSWLLSTGAGGDSISRQAEDQVNAFLKEHHAPYLLSKGYGMSEMSACISACAMEINRPGSCGAPLALTTVGIFEPETDNELGFGQEGEICVRGPHIMLGYYDMPEETANVIRRHSDGEDWVHTGDIGYLDEDGYLYVINRVKRVIIRHDGFKIFPYVIESAIDTVDGIKANYAVGVKDPEHRQGLLPHVFLVKEEGCTTADAELIEKARKICEHSIPEYCLPLSYSFITDVPYTNIGKVDFMALTKKAMELSH